MTVSFLCHTFGVPLTMTSQPRGAGSVMTDRIEFSAPFGPVGWLVERVILRRYLERLIAARGALLATPCPDPGAGLDSRL